MEQHIYYVSLVSHPRLIYYDILLLRKEMLLNDSYLHSDVKVSKVKPTRQQNSFYCRKEGNVFLFNNTSRGALAGTTNVFTVDAV